MARKISVSVDHDICVGNAMCITIATKAFELNEERQAVSANPDGDTDKKLFDRLGLRPAPAEGKPA